LNPVGDNLITACGGVSDILKDGSEQGTFIGKLAENMMTICDHNTLWMKGIKHILICSHGVGNLEVYKSILKAETWLIAHQKEHT
jgi:hypothetical protein